MTERAAGMSGSAAGRQIAAITSHGLSGRVKRSFIEAGRKAGMAIRGQVRVDPVGTFSALSSDNSDVVLFHTTPQNRYTAGPAEVGGCI